LFQRFRDLDLMPKEERDVVLHLIDAMITKHKAETALQTQ